MALRRISCSVWQKGHDLLSRNSTRCRLKAITSEPLSKISLNKEMSTLGNLSLDFPVTSTLKHSGETVLVENLKREDLTETFQLLESAARRGDNIGVGEYRNISDFVEHNRFRSMFAVRNLGSGTIDAVVMVGPYLAARTIRPCLASLQVVTSEGFSRESVWKDCFEMAIGFAKQHPFGLNACITEVFGHCVELIHTLRNDGFVICACIQHAGKVVQRKGRPPVRMYSYLMYKEIGPPDDKRPDSSEFIEISNKFCEMMENKDTDGIVLPEPTPVPRLPTLPAEHFFPSSSLSGIVRQLNMEPDDIDRYYEFFHLAGRTEKGYSSEEFPTKRFFWLIFQSYYNFVLEEKSSGKWVAVFYICPSAFARNRADNEVVDAGLIVAEEFRNAGLGAPCLEVLVSIAKTLDCASFVSDVAIYNSASISISLRIGLNFTGTLPRAIYSPIHGWSDVFLLNLVLKPTSKY